MRGVLGRTHARASPTDERTRHEFSSIRGKRGREKHAGAAEPTRSEDEPEKTETETDTERVARRSFMSFLKDVKAKVPRSNKAGLQSLKTLAVATYTRHQRAQQLRESENDR